MARRGNSSKYGKPPANDDGLKALWEQIKKGASGPVPTSNADLARDIFPSKTINHEDIIDVLKALAEAFEEVEFEEAARVLESYNLNNGGIKQQVLKLLNENMVTSYRATFGVIDQFIDQGATITKAVQCAVALTGVQSPRSAVFESVTNEVEKAYRSFKKRIAWLHYRATFGKIDQFIGQGSKLTDAVKSAVAATGVKSLRALSTSESVYTEVEESYKSFEKETAQLHDLSGHTGRRYIIRWRPVVYQPNGTVSRSSMPPGASPLGGESFIVPDDRLWRRAIRDGFAIVEAETTPAQPSIEGKKTT